MFKAAGIILDIDLPPIEKLLLFTLAEFADEEGVCIIGEETLAKRVGVQRRTVKRYLSFLVAENWIYEHDATRGIRKSELNLEKVFSTEADKEGAWSVNHQ